MKKILTQHLMYGAMVLHQIGLIESVHTVNSEIFARILLSRIALKDIFSTLKIRD